jgi:hypothetical protein
MTKLKVKPFETAQIFDFEVKKGKEQVPPGCLAVLQGYATLSDDKTNKNKHFYPKGFWDSILNDNPSLQEKLDTKTFFGSFRHPEKGESPIPDFDNSSHNIREFKVDDKGVFVTLDVFDNEQGRALKPLLEYGSKLGISTRAYGEVEVNDEGYKVPVKGKYLFVTWDLVSYPAFSETRMTQVSDAAEIELDESVLGAKSKDDVLNSVKSMSRSDAQNLCTYMGYDFNEIADSFEEEGDEGKTDVELALDQAMDKIIKLEKENEELKENNDSGVISALRNKVTILTDELEKAKNVVPVGDSVDVKQLTDSVGFLKSKLKDTKSMLSDMENKNKMIKGIINDKNATIKELEGQVQELTDSVSRYKSEAEKLGKVNKGLEDKISENITAKPTNDSANQPSTTAKRVKKAEPLFRVHTGEEKSQQVSDEAEELRSVFNKLKH